MDLLAKAYHLTVCHQDPSSLFL